MVLVSCYRSTVVAETSDNPARRFQRVPASASDPRSPVKRASLQRGRQNKIPGDENQIESVRKNFPRRDPAQTMRQRPRGGTATRTVQEQPDLLLPRSILMDKEIITRTSGKRLGYIDDIFVDPMSLEVKTLYLRENVSSISIGSAMREHVSLSSLRQIGDVVLVHDESSLWDPPGDENMGFVKVVGSEVQTEDGSTLGRVRDFLFNPDSGQISSIRIDALGLPSIPQELLGCSRLDERDIVAVGPSRTIVRRGAEKRVVKESEGWVAEYVTSFVNLIAGMDIEDLNTASNRDNYRADPAYAAWYEKHAKDYEMYYNQTLPEPVVMDSNRSRQAPQRRRQSEPLALPPPQRRSVNQALRSEPPRRKDSQELNRSSVQSQRQREGSRLNKMPTETPTPRRQSSRMTIDQRTNETDRMMN